MKQVFTSPRGVRMLIESDVLDICGRIQKGDATCGWEGDPRMFVVFNNVTKKYEVLRRGEDNKDRVVSSWEPAQFDARVILNLVEHDTRHTDVLAAVEKHNASVAKTREDNAKQAMAGAKEFVKRTAKQLYLPGHD